MRIEKSTRSNAGNKQYKCHTQKEMEERILRCHRVHFFPVLVFFHSFCFISSLVVPRLSRIRMALRFNLEVPLE